MTTLRTKIITAASAAALAAVGLGLTTTPADAAAASSTAPSAKAAACDKAPWELKVQGEPAGFGAGSASGDYLWHDASGFHLRVTHGKNHDLREYTGVITSSAPLRLDPVKLEKGDVVRRTADHRSIVFAFANHGYLDGVNFHTDCATSLRVSDLHVGNSVLPASHVVLGHYREHPSAVPFTVHRPATT